MTGGRIDLVNLTGKMLSFELTHNEVCRALGVCQCRNGAAPSIYLAAHSALTNRPAEFALAPLIIEARDTGKIRIKQRPNKATKIEAPVVDISESSTRHRRSAKDQA